MLKVVGIGGSTRPGSSTELALEAVLAAVRRRHAKTELFCGGALTLPVYEPDAPLDAKSRGLVEAVCGADALVIGSPAYHGGPSGLVKNALDHLEALREDRRPYLSDRPVGLVVTARGWQAAVSTLAALRQTVHALRGWPTPLGLPINVAELPEGLDVALRSSELAVRVEELAHELASGRDGQPASVHDDVGAGNEARVVG
jgi:FMN reductase